MSVQVVPDEGHFLKSEGVVVERCSELRNQFMLAHQCTYPICRYHGASRFKDMTAWRSDRSVSETSAQSS